MQDKFNFFRPDNYRDYPIVLKSANGSNIKDIEGNDYLDFFAAMGTVSCGHANPLINDALIKQVNTIWASSFFPTDVQLDTIAGINALLPGDHEVLVLYSTGAEAIEQAIRLARSATERKRILSFKDHYHGKSYGTMYLTGIFPECYGPAPDAYRTVIDSDGKDAPDRINELLNAAMGDDVAAVIFEPVLGYSGPRRLHKELFRTIRSFCDTHNVVMIADEILSGFHRCNGWFVTCQEGVVPDIIVFGKGLGNGYPVSGVAASEDLSGHMKGAIPGSTFAGNSLACAVAGGVVDFMRSQDFPEKTKQLEDLFCEYFSVNRAQSLGIETDGMGGLLSIGLQGSPSLRMTDLYLDILRNGVIVSHTHSNLRITPPLTIPMSAFEKGLEIISDCIYRHVETGVRK